MSEMTGMVDRVQAGPKAEFSYVDRLDHDGDPQTMPEIAREITMLRGAAAGVDMRLHHAFEEFEALVRKLQPIVDQSPRPMADGTSPLQGEPVKGAPPLTTGVGGDVRRVYEHLGVVEMQIGTLESRLRNLTASIRL